MKRAALIITSLGHSSTAQETLRVQDTVSALRRIGWRVDVLAPSANPMLSATLASNARVFVVPSLPLMRRPLMCLRGVALASGGDYSVLHGFDEGADIARSVCRMSRKHLAYIAEVHHPKTVGAATVSRAAAIVVPHEHTLLEFREQPPMARVSILPDPHAELADNAFTASEFASAIDGIYTYVLRKHPEIDG